MNKQAVLGEGMLMIYRLILVAFIALIVLGLAAVFYDYDINVRNVEASIFTKKAVDCLVEEGKVNLSRFDEQEDSFMEVCGYSSSDRIYIEARFDEKVLRQGDAGLVWIKELFDIGNHDEIRKYKPGYFRTRLPVRNADELNIFVIVKNEA
ncbi:MAG: hypothetical protein ACP5D2_04135 [Candidatus Nanoarchaeia archaeon]